MSSSLRRLPSRMRPGGQTLLKSRLDQESQAPLLVPEPAAPSPATFAPPVQLHVSGPDSTTEEGSTRSRTPHFPRLELQEQVR